LIVHSGAQQLRDDQQARKILHNFRLLRINLELTGDAIAGIFDEHPDSERNRAFDLRSERIVAGRDAVLELRFHARHAYVVLRPPPGEKVVVVRTTLDGKPGRDLRVDADDLYEAAAAPGPAQDHVLRLHLPPGTSAYSFTFG